ncbi:hypothetical protein BTUL_0329g00010 [Botrytis tulipae]|uniref:Uncharacterized protein n=1 Tax=Botrytis tulipae TaxID=87230 RepID=A0A4Z1E925_9HELO|nr:hypothetical protein BTUL_0329g00010 [Botrytis tulipae]
MSAAILDDSYQDNAVGYCNHEVDDEDHEADSTETTKANEDWQFKYVPNDKTFATSLVAIVNVK